MQRVARYRCPSCLVVTRFPSGPRFAYCPRCGQPLASFDLLPTWLEIQAEPARTAAGPATMHSVSGPNRASAAPPRA